MKIAQHRIFFRELFPVTFVVLLWLIHLAQVFLETSFADYALYPRHLSGLIGIVTAPLLHADFAHLFSNTLPLIVLGMLLFLFYDKPAWPIFLLLYFVTGFITWLIARPAFHLGASGLVYALMAFLLLSGIIRRHPPLMVVSLLVIFLYGSLVWGVVPLEPTVSWEGHLSGMLTGFAFAIYFRKTGPQRKTFIWESEEEPEPEVLPETPVPEGPKIFQPPPPGIYYYYVRRPKNETQEKKD